MTLTLSLRLVAMSWSQTPDFLYLASLEAFRDHLVLCRELDTLPAEAKIETGLQVLEKLTRHDSRVTLLRYIQALMLVYG